MNTRPLDILTGLPRYDDFLGVAEERLAHAHDAPTAVVLIDIDWCGKLNKKQDRDIGDAAIAELGRFLGERADAPITVFRYGGDAFALLMPDLEKEQAFLFAESVRAAFEGDHVVGANGRSVKLPITISCGVAASPDDGSDAAGLMRKCSEALYRAKVSGRNKVALAREEKMVTKTVHYRQGQLEGLSRLAKREKLNEATLLREALDELLRKYNS